MDMGRSRYPSQRPQHPCNFLKEERFQGVAYIFELHAIDMSELVQSVIGCIILCDRAKGRLVEKEVGSEC